MFVCMSVFIVARALPLSYTREFVSAIWRRRAAGVFVLVKEGCSLGTQRLRQWAPLRQESQQAPSLGPPLC